MSQSELQTTCAYCGVGCGVTLPHANDRRIRVSGDTQHPANHGRLCVKGTHLGDILPLKHRLLFPEINNERVDWSLATRTIAERIQQTVAQHGPDSFAFYLSGQLLTEDYYAANKLAKGFIGTANVDTNSRLCMSSAVAAHIRAFGEDAPPSSYEDLELADLVVLVGSNLAWAHPILFQRIQRARAADPNKKLVVIDPRKTATAKEADLHLAINPGADGELFCALLTWLVDHQAVNTRYLDSHVNGFDETVQAARNSLPSDLSGQAQQLGLDSADLTRFFEWFAQTPKTTTVWSMGINQSETGVDNSNAIINAHLATGRIGQSGATAFSITGQPNAMGGREVGGLANQLAAHRMFDAESINAVQQFWQAPNIATRPGLKAVDLFDACLTGKIKVLWIIATNPVASLPDSHKIIKALQQVDTVIVSDVVSDNDTLRYADIKLPGQAWGEKDGTVTNSERCISRQRGFLMAPGQARADWTAIAQVGKALGYTDAFDWHHAHEMFREHAQLSALNTPTPLTFNLSAVAELSFREYQDWQPQQWPLNGSRNSRRLFTNGRFATKSGKANMIPVAPTALALTNNGHRFILNTGRLRDQWHTMTRTGLAKALTRHSHQFEVHIHPTDAAQAGLQNGELCRISSDLGEFFAFARLETAQQPGQLFAPMHWNDSFASKGGVAKVIASVTDPISGQPASKHSQVKLTPMATAYQGFCFIRHDQLNPVWLSETIHFKSMSNEGTLYQFFTDHHPDELAAQSDCGENLHYGQQQKVWATRSDQGLRFWLTIGTNATQWPDLDFLDFAATTNALTLENSTLIAARTDDMSNLGNLVCTCFQVTDRQIEQIILDNPDTTLQSLQQALKCSTNCGSCLSEVKDVLSGFQASINCVDAAVRG
ncbi:MAG: nitrate reductase [Reinekea sp.]